MVDDDGGNSDVHNDKASHCLTLDWRVGFDEL